MTPVAILRIVIFLALLVTSVYLFWTAFHKRYRFLMMGAKEDRTDNTPERIKGFLKYVLAQGKVVAEPAGLGHFVIFWGFIILSFGTLDFIAYQYFGVHLPYGEAGWFLFLHELFSVLVLVALAIAFYRRYVLQPMRLDISVEAGVILGLITILVISDLLVSGLQVALGEQEPSALVPVATGLGALFSGGNPAALNAFHEALVWIHIVTLLGFLVYIPRSKHLHMIAAPFNVYFRKLRPPGALKTLDLEDESVEEFGVGRVNQFTWKQLLDGYACTECGRCHVNCPATLSGKPLSPKYLILKMRDHLVQVGDAMLAQRAAVAAGAGGPDVEVAATAELPSLIGEVYTEDEIWSCTTCRACEEACPVFNEHVDKIIDLRRYLVLTEGKMEPEISRALNNMERQGNAWGRSRASRGDWADGLDVPVLEEGQEVEYLYYAGCAACYDDRNNKVARTLVGLLKKAGVNFAILGGAEECCGESARRLGNEFLFQQMAEQNMEVLKNYKFKKIVTADPHCFNTLKNEYPEFGLNVEVIHHTQLLADLIREGKLKPEKSLDLDVTYHDSCYLGRYNGEYDAPRYILESIPGVNLVEMERSRERGMCCGGGGGGMWKEERLGNRINVMRTEQAMETGAEAIASACPYCLIMMEDGTKAKGVSETVKTLDVVEMLDMSVN
ncbi:MAG: (Fe-S)-binding protein [Alicyclobacillaceae bacterium]|nr:(Fe-S)-binding protein [Alicyclobacillaceae bacterium]